MSDDLLGYTSYVPRTLYLFSLTHSWNPGTREARTHREEPSRGLQGGAGLGEALPGGGLGLLGPKDAQGVQPTPCPLQEVQRAEPGSAGRAQRSRRRSAADAPPAAATGGAKAAWRCRARLRPLRHGWHRPPPPSRRRSSPGAVREAADRGRCGARPLPVRRASPVAASYDRGAGASRAVRERAVPRAAGAVPGSPASARPSPPPRRSHVGAALPVAGLVPLALLEGGDGAHPGGAAVLRQDHLRQRHRGERAGRGQGAGRAAAFPLRRGGHCGLGAACRRPARDGAAGIPGLGPVRGRLSPGRRAEHRAVRPAERRVRALRGGLCRLPSASGLFLA